MKRQDPAKYTHWLCLSLAPLMYIKKTFLIMCIWGFSKHGYLWRRVGVMSHFMWVLSGPLEELCAFLALHPSLQPSVDFTVLKTCINVQWGQSPNNLVSAKAGYRRCPTPVTLHHRWWKNLLIHSNIQVTALVSTSLTSQVPSLVTWLVPHCLQFLVTLFSSQSFV